MVLRWIPSLVLVLLFIVNTAITIVWCLSMADMGAMPVAGGGTMSMTWLLMCGQTWFDAAASFLSMWLAMMAAMMLPSLGLMLRRHVASSWLMTFVTLGYFFVWAVVGLMVFLLGASVAEAATRVPALARALPLASGVIVVLAGGFQFTVWKARYLRDCRAGARHPLAIDPAAAWRQGWCLGVKCCASCAGLTAILLAVDMMNLWLMGLIALAITAERLAPTDMPAARVIGVIALAAGVFLMMRAL